MTLMPPYKRCVYSAITAIKHLTLSFLSKSSLGYNIFWSTNPFLDHTHLVFHVPLFCKKKKKLQINLYSLYLSDKFFTDFLLQVLLAACNHLSRC